MFDFGGLLDFTYHDLVFSCSISIYKQAEYLIRYSARVVGELEFNLAHDVNVSELVQACHLGLVTSPSLAQLMRFFM
jgi:hypothetical protein